MAQKAIYFFGAGKVEGDASMKALLGGKGANLAEMIKIGIPVPAGFTISTEVCAAYYEHDRQMPADVEDALTANMKKLEEAMGKEFGNPQNPLLVSVRSGAAVSMPGMMDTILNLGMNDAVVKGMAEITNNPRFAWDAYRRFIQMFGNVTKGMDIEVFEEILEKVKEAKGVELDTGLDATDLQKLVEAYKAAYTKHLGEDFPQDPRTQLDAAIEAVFGSWHNPKAEKYRKINNIRGLKGTAVNVQAMVFGNFGDTSGTGVCFTRDPSTGENYFYGEYLMNAQGEDVVAGIRTPGEIAELDKNNPVIYKQLIELKDKLEQHYRDMQDIEFTIQEGDLYILQTRNAKRTGAAAVRCAVEMQAEGAISKEEAVMRVSPDQLDQLFHPRIDPKTKKDLTILAKGLNASPGAACGRIVFTADDAEAWKAKGEAVLLVRRETSPDDIGGMDAAKGILTSTGGMTSHAAVVARGMGRPCVAGCKDVVIKNKEMAVAGKIFKEGDYITIDGTTGEVIEGKLELIEPQIGDNVGVLLSWADDIRDNAERCGLKGFDVRTNADQPKDAEVAVEYGAKGIGLCRTEHMFFEEGKLEIFQEMIVAEDLVAREKSLAKLLPLQQKDFEGLFRALKAYPVTVRLLDPPLHEFVPGTQEGVKALAKQIGISEDKLHAKIESLHELNPMLGHRGCRLGITYPEIYDMQVEAIMAAAVNVKKSGMDVKPEIMIPLVGTVEELALLRANAQKVVDKVLANANVDIDYKIGTMIEIPRAALTADEVATEAEFFSFGTNDLTQMTFGYSRDDVGSFVPEYLDKNILPQDPFQSIDTEGVGQLVEIAIERGRKARPGMKMGVCGEHGGDPASIEFFYKAGLDYVSCSPFRVPIARLAGAQAVVRNRKCCCC